MLSESECLKYIQTWCVPRGQLKPMGQTTPQIKTKKIHISVEKKDRVLTLIAA